MFGENSKPLLKRLESRMCDEGTREIEKLSALLVANFSRGIYYRCARKSAEAVFALFCDINITRRKCVTLIYPHFVAVTCTYYYLSYIRYSFSLSRCYFQSDFLSLHFIITKERNICFAARFELILSNVALNLRFTKFRRKSKWSITRTLRHVPKFIHGGLSKHNVASFDFAFAGQSVVSQSGDRDDNK